MQHQIDAIGLAPNVFEKCFNLIVAGDVAGEQRSFFSELSGQFLDIFFQSFALIIENQPRTRRGPSLCDRPGDAALVRYTKNESDFSCQNLVGHKKSKELQGYKDSARRKPIANCMPARRQPRQAMRLPYKHTTRW